MWALFGKFYALYVFWANTALKNNYKLYKLLNYRIVSTKFHGFGAYLFWPLRFTTYCKEAVCPDLT